MHDNETVLDESRCAPERLKGMASEPGRFCSRDFDHALRRVRFGDVQSKSETAAVSRRPCLRGLGREKLLPKLSFSLPDSGIFDWLKPPSPSPHSETSPETRRNKIARGQAPKACF
jgi:hypothetical protein